MTFGNKINFVPFGFVWFFILFDKIIEDQNNMYGRKHNSLFSLYYLIILCNAIIIFFNKAINSFSLFQIGKLFSRPESGLGFYKNG